MPMDRSLYPKNWDEIALVVKDAAGWQCRECGRPCFQPSEDFCHFMGRVLPTEWGGELPDEEEFYLMTDREFRSVKATFTLTVAHLNHRPEDCRSENLKALCSVCHLRYDNTQRQLKRRLKAERNGQLNLLGGVEHG